MMRINFTVEFNHKLTAWILQMGGWLPPAFASVDILLVDRNVLSTLKALLRHPERQDLIADRWWLEFLNRSSIRLNPVLAAMEGRWRSTPSFSGFCEELEEATDILTAALPEANIVRQRSEHHKNVYQVLESQLPRFHRESKFLQEVAPLLASRAAAGREHSLENQIFLLAASNGISKCSFPCMCALSTLYERSDGDEPKIGRGVLKPTHSYSADDAFNALSDFRAIEFIGVASSIGLGNAGLCTRDKYLAAFWVYAAPSKVEWRNGAIVTTYAPRKELFPRLDEAAFHDLLARVGDA